jgi:hypothetical protein
MEVSFFDMAIASLTIGVVVTIAIWIHHFLDKNPRVCGLIVLILVNIMMIVNFSGTIDGSIFSSTCGHSGYNDGLVFGDAFAIFTLMLDIYLLIAFFRP